MDGGKISLVLSCVDNYGARLAVNQGCVELDQAWIESGVSEDAMSGHFQYLLPGRTACFACVPPLVVASGIDESTLKREGVCAASLPTTMGIVAGLMVQNTLKILLDFGQLSYYLGDSATNDFFPRDVVKPNPDCTMQACVLAQSKWRGWNHEELTQQNETSSSMPVHETNEWNITCIDTVDVEVETSPSPAPNDTNESQTDLPNLDQLMLELSKEQE